jgi:hypothetical protein
MHLHKKNLHVDSTRSGVRYFYFQSHAYMHVIENKNMRADLTRMRVVKKTKKQKAKHGTGACRSKVNVYYDELS